MSTAVGTEDLKAGTCVQSRNGMRSGVVGEVLGAGGQGSVYLLEMEGGVFALKWYHDHYIEIDSGLYQRLAKAVERGAPDNRFLWPLELVHIPGRTSFGYVMPLRDTKFVGMRRLIAPPPKRIELSLGQRVSVCAHIAHCFLELHASGFCYQDINFGNVFLNPDTANVLICDNDNVNIDGAEASIYGTRKFMAPEVVRREMLPSTITDLFSMAVMFFYVIFGWHPLDGRRESEIKILDTGAENKLYGSEPIFIFDSVNTANGPVEPLHNTLVYRWRSLSSDLRDLFTRSFTVGLFSAGKRVHEYEWRAAFSAAVAKAFQCRKCGYENLAELSRDGELLPAQCGYCEENPSTPAILSAGKRVVVLEGGRQVLGSQIADGAPETPVATVDAHPQQEGVLGLRNRSEETWRAEIPGYSATPIGPDKTIRLIDQLKLNIAGADVRIVNPHDQGEADE